MKHTPEPVHKGVSIKADILSGNIYFEDSILKGDGIKYHTAYFRRLGFKYSQVSNGVVVDFEALPIELQHALIQAKSNFRQNAEKALEFLAGYTLLSSITEDEVFMSLYMRNLTALDNKLTKTLNQKNIKLLSLEERKAIAKKYISDLDKNIKNFSEQMTIDMKTQLSNRLLSGRINPNTVQDILRDMYRLSDKKSKFLAEQETNLFTAKYREVLYTKNGIFRYIWKGKMDSKEREDHKKLEGQIHYFSNPPIIDQATGRKGNPGEDFNCRCVPIPVVEG